MLIRFQQATGYFYDDQGQLEYTYYYEGDGDLDGDNENYIAGDYAEYIHYTYDTLGRKLAETVVDDNGGSPLTTYEAAYHYDTEGRLHVLDTPQGVIEYRYNPVTGSKTDTVSYPTGTPYEDIVDLTAVPNNTTTYDYDALGRLENVNDTVHYGYDEVGSRAWQCIDATGDFAIDSGVPTGYEIKTEYIYNNLNRLTQLIQQKTGPIQLASYQYTINADGSRTGLNESLHETRDIDYGYDNLNRLVSENADSDGDGYYTDYVYDLAGNRIRREITVNNQPFITDYTYYPGTDMLYTETHCGASCAVIIGHEKYYAYAGSGLDGCTYRDSQGHRVSALKAFLYGLPSKWNSILFYTLMILIPIVFFLPVLYKWRQRVGWSVPALSEEGLSPDLKLWHRMLCVLLAYIFLVGPDIFQQYAHAEAEYADLGTGTWGQVDRTITYTYDDNGAVETKTTTVTSTSIPIETVTNEYNLTGRLKKVTTDDGATGHVVEYLYNDTGIRVQAYSYDQHSGGGAKSNEKTVVYLVDPSNHTGDAQVIEEKAYSGTDTSGVPDSLTTYAIGDDVISQTVDGATEYLLNDGHGSTRQLVSVSDDATPVITVADTYSYDGYGVLLQDEDNFPSVGTQKPGYTPQQATSLLYAGEMFDADAQQYYLRARYYSPLTGTFNRMDPYSGNMQDPQSLHKYTYVHNNPVDAIDPSGMMVSFTLIGQLVISKIQSILRSINQTYITHVAPQLYFYMYQAYQLYQWGMYQLQKVWIGLNILDMSLSILDEMAAAWLRNNQPIPASHVDRGVMLENVAGANLRGNFPKIDDWRPSTGVATSIKTHGLSTSTELLNAISRDVRKLNGVGSEPLEGIAANGDRIRIAAGQIKTRCLLVGVPQNQTQWLSMQSFRTSIQQLQTQTRTVIRVVPVKGWKKK